MNLELKNLLINIAKKSISNDDPSHDFEHALRVLSNAQMIANQEKADFDILIPASLFHDVITYPKNSNKRFDSQKDSAKKAELILREIKQFPKNKINAVKICIQECSFSKSIKPKLLESKILQDAVVLKQLELSLL